MQRETATKSIYKRLPCAKGNCREANMQKRLPCAKGNCREANMQKRLPCAKGNCRESNILKRLPCVKGAPAIAGEGLFYKRVAACVKQKNVQTIPPSFAAQNPPPFTQGRLGIRGSLWRVTSLWSRETDPHMGEAYKVC